MPRRYVAEMIMDRISASRVYLGDAYTDQAPYQYLKKGIGHLWFVHPETLSQLEFLLRMLSERGEDDTLYYIRYHFLKGDPVPRMHCPQECTVYEEAIRKKCPRPLIKVLDPPALPILLSVPFPQQKYNLLQQPYKLYYKFQKGESPITWNQPPAKPNTTP